MAAEVGVGGECPFYRPVCVEDRDKPVCVRAKEGETSVCVCVCVCVIERGIEKPAQVKHGAQRTMTVRRMRASAPRTLQ